MPAYLRKMDPRTGSFGESKQPRRPNGAKSAAKAGKLKSVTLRVEWGYECHDHTVPARVWKQIVAGKHISRRGEPYHYEGDRFSCWWEFNGREGAGSLIVSYSGGGDGYVGTWEDALNEEDYA